MQPDPADRYLTVWDTRRDEPVADYDGRADMPWGSGAALRRDNPEGGNAYWDIGYIIAFLTALYRATGGHDYLIAAREMFDLFDGYAGFADHVWKDTLGPAPRCTRRTAEPRYLAAAVQDGRPHRGRAASRRRLLPWTPVLLHRRSDRAMVACCSATTRSCRPILISSSTPPRRRLTTWRRYGPSSEE